MAYRALSFRTAQPGMYLRQGNTYTLVVNWVLAVEYDPDDPDTEYQQHLVALTHFDMAIPLEDAIADAVKRVHEGITFTTQTPKPPEAIVNR